MDRNSLTNIVRSTAGSVGIDPNLAQAIAEVETNCDATKTRFEPKWSYFLTPDLFAKKLGITETTERIHQATSWGAMQVMGSVVRELSFAAQLPTLIQPQLGTLYGCRKLHSLHAKYDLISDIIAAYNAGHADKARGEYINQEYVNKVMEKVIRLRKLK